MGSFSKTLQRTLITKSRDKAAVQLIVPLPEGRTFWATHVPKSEWCQLQPGQLIVFCRKGKKEMLGFEVVENKMGFEANPFLLAMKLDGSLDVLILASEIQSLIRFEVRDQADPSTALEELLVKMPLPN